MFFTPRWIISHLFVLALVGAFIGAGVWQIDRLNERKEENALVALRMGETESYSSVKLADPESLEFRRVRVEGRFDAGSQILIANRSDQGSPGFWMWTNFVTSDGQDLLVNRGFVGRGVILQTAGAAPLSDAAPTPGMVTIEGLLRRGLDGGRVTEAGDQLSRPDAILAVELLGLEPGLDPSIYMEIEAQDPPRLSSIPRPVPSPDLSEGPHRSYAFQWFTFATIGIVGYAAVLLRIRRGDQARGDVPHDLEPSAQPPAVGV
jgi:surfeit locus 1 family protein